MASSGNRPWRIANMLAPTRLDTPILTSESFAGEFWMPSVPGLKNYYTGTHGNIYTKEALTPEEKRAGFRLLFDGRTFHGWRDPATQKPPGDGWVIEDLNTAAENANAKPASKKPAAPAKAPAKTVKK